MFRVLSNEESTKVKKWRAPNLGDSDGVSNPLAGLTTRPVVREPDDKTTTTDITHLRSVIQEASADASVTKVDLADMQIEDDKDRGPHASLAMSSPSADMLQQTYDEGYSAGVDASLPLIDSVGTDALVSLLASLAQKKYQMDSDIEQEIVSLAKAIAKLVVRREVETDDNVIVGIVNSALAQIPMTSASITVFLHPADLAVIQNLETSPVSAMLKADEDMLRGDCRIESGASILDAGVNALVDSIASSPAHVHEQSPSTDPTS